MKISLVADGFTGASNIALTRAEADMSVTQIIGVPARPADRDLSAGVLVSKMRTSPVSEAIVTSLAVCEWLVAQGARQIILKVGSTFSKKSGMGGDEGVWGCPLWIMQPGDMSVGTTVSRNGACPAD